MPMLKKYHTGLFFVSLVLLSTVAASYGQPAAKTVNNWETLINDAKPDTNKIKLLIEITDKVMLDYFNGRDEKNLTVVQKLLNQTTSISSSLKYANGYNRCLLLKSRLLYIQNKDSTAAVLHKEAVSFFKNANPIDAAEAFHFLSEAWKFRRHYQQIIIADSTWYQKALAYYKLVKDNLKTASLQRAIAIIHTTNGQLFKAIHEFQDLYKFQVEINDSSRHKTTDMLAHCYAINGQFKEAIFYFQQSLKYAAEIKDSMDICLYYYRAGRISYNIHEIDKGTAYMMQSLRLAELQRDTFLCMHISFIIYREGLIEEGKYREGLNKTLELLKKYPNTAKNDNTLNLDILNGLANCYFHLKQYPLAEKYYLQAMNVAEHEQGLGLPLHKIPIYTDIGRLYMQQQKMDKAAQYFQKALELSQEIKSFPNIKKIQLELFKLDSTNGNYLSAIKHYQLYKAVTDSMFNESKSKQIEELEIQYKTEQKEKEFQLLANQNLLQQKTISQGKSIRNAIITGAALVLLLLLVVLNRYQVKQRANKLLQVKQEEINLQNKSLEKLVQDEKKLLDEKDKLLEEKEWLMKEIHHRVKNNLQIVMSLLNSQSAYLKDDAALEAIRESQHRVHAISLIHQKLYQSENLSVIDMAAYIKDVVEYLADNLDAAHRIRFNVFIKPLELDVAQAVPLGLIINEAVTNSVKYAFPDEGNGEINIKLQQSTTDGIVLDIQDDGIGLPKNFNWQHTPSLGMSLMQGLAKQLDGQFEVINNNGLTVQVKFMPGKINLSNTQK
jgi:two-component system, sensor histidine kinase PdtaS